MERLLVLQGLVASKATQDRINQNLIYKIIITQQGYKSFDIVIKRKENINGKWDVGFVMVKRLLDIEPSAYFDRLLDNAYAIKEHRTDTRCIFDYIMLELANIFVDCYNVTGYVVKY